MAGLLDRIRHFIKIERVQKEASHALDAAAAALKEAWTEAARPA